MFEAVGTFRRLATLGNEFRIEQLTERFVKSRIRQRGNRPQDRIREFSTNGGTKLHHLLPLGQTIEAGHERILQGCGDCKRG
jgi:hypothetical protein